MSGCKDGPYLYRIEPRLAKVILLLSDLLVKVKHGALDMFTLELF